MNSYKTSLHLKKDNTTSAPRMNCVLCNKMIRVSNWSYHEKSKKHKRLMGDGPKPKPVKLYQCTKIDDECDFTTTHKSSYYRHLKLHTPGQIKPRKYLYNCSACECGVRDNSNVKQHIQTSAHHKNVVEKYPDYCLKKLSGGRFRILQKNWTRMITKN